MRTHYCIFKNFEGLIFKKHKSNSHLLFIPTESDFYYFLLIGKDDSDIHYAVLLMQEAVNKMSTVLQGQKKLLESKFEEIESLQSSSKSIGDEEYLIKIPSPGKYIKSDIEFKFYEDSPVKLSGKEYLVYTLDFDFSPKFLEDDVETNTVSNLKMSILKKLAFVKPLLKD